jgi:hypothetical protein
MSSPIVSIAMVVRNMERFLADSIESILAQTFRDFEFVIVDFGSTDRSSAIVEQYRAKDSRIRLHSIGECSLPEARTASLQFARGQHIALMDADDIAFPQRLERQVAYLESHPDVALLGSAIECMDEHGKRQFTREFPLSDADIRVGLQRGTVLHQTTVIFRRGVLDTVKGYRRAFPLSEDYDLWLRVIEHFRVANLAEPLVRYRLHSHQVSVRKLRQEITCLVAARAAAQLRARGSEDPLWRVDEITPAVLAQLGVSDATLNAALFAGYSDWMNAMLQAGNHDAALELIRQMVQLPRGGSADNAIVSNACLTAAQIHLQRGAFLAAQLWTIRAVAIRPVVAARPFKALLQRTPPTLASTEAASPRAN